MLAISACLCGIACRYDGKANTIPVFKEMLERGEAIAICPEVSAKLTTPRSPAEIVGGEGKDVWLENARVMTKDQQDVTSAFQLGAKLAAAELQQHQITCAILKSKSPSCGCLQIYDGTFSGELKAGSGVTTAYFEKLGIEVFSEETWFQQDNID